MYRAFSSTDFTFTARIMPALCTLQLTAPSDHSGIKYCMAGLAGVENFTNRWSEDRLLYSRISSSKPPLSAKQNRLQTRFRPSGSLASRNVV